MGKALNELRILIVEDEPVLSLDLQDILADLGHRVVGTAPRLEPAIDLARNADFDVAVLDVNLGGAVSLSYLSRVMGRPRQVIRQPLSSKSLTTPVSWRGQSRKR